ncbi:MAG: hypothetical protein Q9191_001669 [Dirinaria sp. TL-2023a]
MEMPLPFSTDATNSFPFLKLPREVRYAIYRLVLTAAPFVSTLNLEKETPTWWMHHPAWDPDVSKTYLGSEKSTRLFRVNRQIAAEAMDVFYSSFIFNYSLPLTYDSKRTASLFRRILSMRVRSLIKKLVLEPTIFMNLNPKKHSTNLVEREKQCIVEVLHWLPNVTHVELDFWLHRAPAAKHDASAIVAQVVEIMMPLRKVPTLIIRSFWRTPKSDDQVTRILTGVREALGRPDLEF